MPYISGLGKTFHTLLCPLICTYVLKKIDQRKLIKEAKYVTRPEGMVIFSAFLSAFGRIVSNGSGFSPNMHSSAMVLLSVRMDSGQALLAPIILSN